jgi:hypothetical protein
VGRPQACARGPGELHPRPRAEPCRCAARPGRGSSNEEAATPAAAFVAEDGSPTDPDAPELAHLVLRLQRRIGSASARSPGPMREVGPDTAAKLRAHGVLPGTCWRGRESNPAPGRLTPRKTTRPTSEHLSPGCRRSVPGRVPEGQAAPRRAPAGSKSRCVVGPSWPFAGREQAFDRAHPRGEPREPAQRSLGGFPPDRRARASST